MTVVRAAASADHGEARQQSLKLPILGAEALGVAGVELGAAVELRMALGGRRSRR
ncbi:MAG TPA: hypothetical protein VFC18_13945 [Burkholderiales bacterium]|nr:hypothetical protein [Burkholderiales bacterium]